MEKLNIKNFKIIKRIQKQNSKSSSFYLGSLRDMKIFISYLYPNLCFDNIGLKRKFNKMQEIFNCKNYERFNKV